MLTLREKQRSLYDPENATEEAMLWRWKATRAKLDRAHRRFEEACKASTVPVHYLGDDPRVRSLAETIASLGSEIHYIEYVRRNG